LPIKASYTACLIRGMPVRVAIMKASQLSRQAIEHFKNIYLDEFGENISDEQAQEMGLGLLNLLKILLQHDGARR
jgi:hypothetical protein